MRSIFKMAAMNIIFIQLQCSKVQKSKQRKQALMQNYTQGTLQPTEHRSGSYRKARLEVISYDLYL